MRAIITTAVGAAIELEGSAAEISTIIAQAVGSGPAPKRGPGRPPGPTTATPTSPKRKPPSPARARAMKLQGAYMGVVRVLPEKQKAEVKAVTAKQGMPAGLALAKKYRAAAEAKA